MEGNLFSLTQCIEVAENESRPVRIAFMDIKGAFDNVVQENLWHIMRSLKVDKGIPEFVKNVYRDNNK